MGLRVIVSDDVQTTGSGASTEYAVYFMTQGAVGGSEHTALTTETDRDILALSDALAISLGYCYHPIGAKWGVTTVNPTRSQLETVPTGRRCTKPRTLVSSARPLLAPLIEGGN